MKRDDNVTLAVLVFTAAFIAPFVVLLARLNVWAGGAVIALLITGAYMIKPD